MNETFEREKLLEICQQRVSQLETCYRVNSLLSSEFDLGSLLNVIMETAKQVMSADASSLLLLDPKSGDLVFQVALSEVGGQLKTLARVKMGEGIAGTVAETGKPLIIKDAYAHPKFNPAYDKKTGFKTGSILCAPLKVKGEILGVCQVIHGRDGGREFAGPELGLFEMFCSTAALALQNARAHQALMEQQKMEKDMDFARTVQESFLPVVPPQSGDFRFAARFLPARNVGGDFFDFIPCPKNMLGVVIGDVSGKGVPAALHMARLMSDFRFMSQQMCEPEKVLEEVNRIFCTRSFRGIFATALLLRFDTERNVIRAANAGHPPLIKADARGETSLLADASGPPLGVLPNSVYSGTDIPMTPGDRLLLYTDGVTEPVDPEGEAFGMQRVQEIFARDDHNQPQTKLDTLVGKIRQFTGAHTPQFDDLTLVAIDYAISGG